MGSMCNNYGTFIAPPGFPEVEGYGDGEDTAYRHGSQEYAPSFEEGTTISSRVEHNTPGGSERRFGLGFNKAGMEGLYSEMDGDRGRVSACSRCTGSRNAPTAMGVLVKCLLACVLIHFLQVAIRSRLASQQQLRTRTYCNKSVGSCRSGDGVMVPLCGPLFVQPSG